MSVSAPKVLLVGVGRFGRQHLDAWQILSESGEARLVGAIASSPASAARRSREFDFPVNGELTDELLDSVDAVDIVTPATTHFALTSRCLERCHVFVEKPLATTAEECAALAAHAERTGRLLMVNHLYRYHPVTRTLTDRLAQAGEAPRFLRGRLLNPASEYDPSRDIGLEFLHLLDLLDLLTGERPVVRHTASMGRWNRLSLGFPGSAAAVLDIGWRGAGRVRRLEIEFDSIRLDADFVRGTVVETRADEVIKHFASRSPGSLETAMRAFLAAMREPSIAREAKFPDAGTAGRVVAEAIRCRPGPRARAPRIAVIGGGVFGATCAIELAELGETTLYERHDELLTEASFANQWRHHSGFHYPRSASTVQEIQETKAEFEEVYGEIVLPIDSYYATAATARHITGARYLDACRGMGLNFTMEAPPADCLRLDRVSICVKSDERVLDFPALRSLIRQRLEAAPALRLELGSEVFGARLEPDGAKVLTIARDGGTDERTFDYVVNAGYANTNLLPHWLGLPRRRLRFDLCEMLVLEIDMPSISMTVLDGPFTSLVATGRDNLFILSQIHESVLRSARPASGLPPAMPATATNRENLLASGRRYFPPVERGRFVESRYGMRTVVAANEDYDARPTVVTAHGFGCWSLLGGKILTCVSNARHIAREIERAEGR